MRKKEIKIALIFLLSVFVVYWGINYLKGKNIFSSQTILYAEYDHIAGLQEANPIMLNGYKIGQVSKIEFADGNQGKLKVSLLITEDINIPKNSIARIGSSDLLGSKAIIMFLGDSKDYAKNGDKLKSELERDLKDEVSMQILPLKNKAEELLSSFDSVLVIFQTIFDENTRKNISASFESIENTIKSLEHTSYNLDTLMSSQKNRLAHIISNVESITANLKNNSDKINHIFENLDSFSDSISKSDFKRVIYNANNSLDQFNTVMTKINSGEGSMGMLVNDTVLYNNLNNSASELDLLIEDLRLNPKRYLHFSIFGRSSKRNEYKPNK